jgi:hypothetical protein
MTTCRPLRLLPLLLRLFYHREDPRRYNTNIRDRFRRYSNALRQWLLRLSNHLRGYDTPLTDSHSYHPSAEATTSTDSTYPTSDSYPTSEVTSTPAYPNVPQGLPIPRQKLRRHIRQPQPDFALVRRSGPSLPTLPSLSY